MGRGGVFGGRDRKADLEIIPSSPFVVLYGGPNEARPAELTGVLRLTTSEATSIRGIKMSLTGFRRTFWMSENANPQPIIWKKWFYRDELNIAPTEGNRNRSLKIAEGATEWNFRFEIPGDLDESVEGLPGTFIVYDLHATIDRGLKGKNIKAMKHVRIIRTLGTDAMDIGPMEQTNDDIWANKIAYRIVVPQKNFIVGTPVTAQFSLVPLKKGLRIGKVKMELVEHQMLGAVIPGNPNMMERVRDVPVCTSEQEVPSGCDVAVTPEIEALGVEDVYDEAYRFKTRMELPKTLKLCRQSVDTEFIKLVHKLKIYVNLHNPEGHVSQLVVKNHVNLFISPNLPPTEDGSVIIDHGLISTAEMEEEARQVAPPTYELHQLDALYNDIDPNGFQSNVNSAVNTPRLGRSRTPSIDNLNSAAAAGATIGGASAAQLRSRLANLSQEQNSTSNDEGRNRSNSSGSDSDGAPVEQTNSRTTESNNPTPGQDLSGGSYFALRRVLRGEYDMDALSRTPSYDAAVRTPPVSTPGELENSPPSYEVATSRPTTPNNSTPPRARSSSRSPSGNLTTVREEPADLRAHRMSSGSFLTNRAQEVAAS